MVVAGIGIVVNTATALLFMRGRESDLNIRGAFLHMAADALVSAGVVVAGGLALWFGWTWLDPVVSLIIAAVIVVGHLEPVQAVAAPAVRRRARQRGPACGAGPARIAARRGSACTTCTSGPWAPSEIALTAHLVMPEGHADDAFLQAGHRRNCTSAFEIEHVTLQVMRVPFTRACAVRSPGPRTRHSPAAAGRNDAHAHQLDRT